MSFIYKYKNKLSIIASILVLIPFLFNIGLEVDEPFTMGLIKHNYMEIINLTTLDIHPPLYYFVLKAFLSITTFWTSNIFIKIIFARLLSTIFSILTFVNLLSISNKLNIKINKYTQLILFLLLPLSFGLESQITNIRMYSLAMLLTIWQVNLIVSFWKTKNYKYLFIVIIPLTLSLYNNYFGGLISGLFFILLFVDFLYHKKMKYAFSVLISGITSLLLFIPWIPSLMNQLYLTKYDTLINSHVFIRFLIIFIGIILILSLSLFIKLKNNFKHLNKYACKLLVYSYLILLISLFIVIVVRPNALSLRYVSPILIIFMFLCSNIYITTNKNTKCTKIMSILLCILLLVSFAKSLKAQIINDDIPSISFIKAFNNISNDKNKNINIDKYGLDKYFKYPKAGNSIYLYSIHKNISNKNYVNKYDLLGNGNDKLFKAIFPNIKHSFKKHF